MSSMSGDTRFPLRQQDIADLLGLTPEHVSRVVTKLRNAGLFEFSGGFLQVRDIEALRRTGRRGDDRPSPPDQRVR